MKLYASPALYYAAERNPTEAVALLLEYGADPNIYLSFDILLLAFAITHGRCTVIYGTDPNTIPQDMWIQFLNTPKVTRPTGQIESTSWCNDKIRAVLAPALHLAHRHPLYHANELGKRKTGSCESPQGTT